MKPLGQHTFGSLDCWICGPTICHRGTAALIRDRAIHEDSRLDWMWRAFRRNALWVRQRQAESGRKMRKEAAAAIQLTGVKISE